LTLDSCNGYGKLSQAELFEILSYDPLTGLFTWLVDRKSNKVKGTIAGALKEGYINISYNGHYYRAHWLAWLYVHGAYPPELDHKNRDKADNRIDNLRESTRSKNAQNRSVNPRNQTGVSGVFQSKRDGKYIVSITVNKVNHHLGTFKNIEDAIEARLTAEKQFNFGDNYA